MRPENVLPVLSASSEISLSSCGLLIERNENSEIVGAGTGSFFEGAPDPPQLANEKAKAIKKTLR